MMHTAHFLKSLLDSSADGIIFNDLEGKVIFYSKGAEQIFGYKAKEIIDQSVVRIYGDRELARKVKKKLIESPNNILRNYETDAVTSDGEKIFIRVTASLVKDENERVIGVLGVCSDITEKKKLEDELHRSEKKLRCLFENIREGIFSLDKNGAIISINPAGAKILGYQQEEILGKNIAQYCVYPGDEEQLMSDLRKKGYVKNHLCFLKRKDGKKIYIELTCNSVGNREAPLEGVFRDVTERLKTQQLVEEYSSQLEQAVEKRTKEIRDIKDFTIEVIEIATDMVYALDLEGKCRLMNQAAERITGYERDEWVGRPFIELVAPEYVTKVLNIIKKAAISEEIIPQKIEITASGGKRVPVQLSARVLMRNNTIAGIAIVARDLTEQKKLESKMKEALEELKKRYESRIEAISLASHDAASPLTSIEQCAQILEIKMGEQKQLEILKQNLKREKKLIEHVLELSRLDYREQELDCSPVNFHKLIAPLLDNCAILGRRIRIEAKDELVMIADHEKLRSTLDHLISHAIRNSPVESEIAISAEELLDGYIIRVSDQGKGIPKAKQQFLFEKIYPGDRLSEEELKNKIDLLVAKQYVGHHGGRIWVESEIEQGCTFCLTIPGRRS